MLIDEKIKKNRRGIWIAWACLAALVAGYVLFVEVVMVPGWPAGTVAVVDDENGWKAGVRAYPLEPGQSLAFDFGSATNPVWDMSDVSYPLLLTAVDRRGKALGSLLMKPCRATDPALCPAYVLDVSSRYWVETRLSRSTVQKESEGQR